MIGYFFHQLMLSQRLPCATWCLSFLCGDYKSLESDIWSWGLLLFALPYYPPICVDLCKYYYIVCYVYIPFSLSRFSEEYLYLIA